MTITRRKLMVGTAAMTAASLPIAVRAADPEEQQLLTVFRHLDDERRALVHEVMRQMVGLPLDPGLTRRRGLKPDGVTPLKAGEAPL